MSATADLTSSTAPTGWTCYYCGGFVPNGCTHSCPTSVTPWPQHRILDWPPAPLWDPKGPQRPHERILQWAEEVREASER